MKERRPGILHVDLDPFFVSVERSLDPSLRGRPVIVGGSAGPDGLVAAASAEARAHGVRAGQTVRRAQELCPDAAFRPGDLETYGRVGEDVTSILLAASRRVERPSTDEAYVDLTPEGGARTGPVAAAESIKDELQRRLGLDVSLGLASCRLAARVASSFARPRGLLLLLPGYESSFIAPRSLGFLDLPPHFESALGQAGIETIGQVAEADETVLGAAVGAAAAKHLRAAARGEGDEPIPVAAPPERIQEEATIRDRRSDSAALLDVTDGLARRASRRLRAFGLASEHVTVEVRRAEGVLRRSEGVRPALQDADELAAVVTALAEPLLRPAAGVRGLVLRLGRLQRPTTQAWLFSDSPRARDGSGR